MMPSVLECDGRDVMLKRKIVVVLLLLVFFAASVASAQDNEEPTQFARGRVLVVEAIPGEGNLDEFGFVLEEYAVEVEITSGQFRGRTLTIEHVLTGTAAYDVVVQPGDRVLLAIETSLGELDQVFIADHERDRTLLWMAIGFAALLLVLGGMKGLKSLISLLLIGVMIAGFFIPLLLRGYNPIALAVVVSAVATVFTIAMVGGANRKGLAAMIGTLAGVLVAGVLAVGVGLIVKTSGLAGEEAQMLLFIPQGVDFDFRGLLMAGIIIGALGAVMDVGMSIASAVNEVKLANPELRSRDLFWAGMNVGRDIMGTMANTLILAYTGGALTLLLLVSAYEVPLIRLLNMESIATEILRALAGSTGLVAAIPLTALAAAGLHRKRA
jgi:uncharacterized membrane protein